MTEADYQPVDSTNGPHTYQDTVSTILLQSYQDPGLTARMDD
jgi:hypothetical protein